MKIKVNASVPYDVVIERGLIKNIGKAALEYITPCNCLIVTDDNVDRLYGKACEDSLKQAGFNVNKFVFKHGEASKNIDSTSLVISHLFFCFRQGAGF